MEDKESLLEEITELEQKVRDFVKTGKSTEAVRCQQKILQNKLKLVKMKDMNP